METNREKYPTEPDMAGYYIESLEDRENGILTKNENGKIIKKNVSGELRELEKPPVTVYDAEGEKVYPTQPDAEGWFFNDEGNEAMGIFTKQEGENLTKKVVLSDGKTAIIKELHGSDMDTARKMAGKNDKEGVKFTNAVLSLALTIDGKSSPFEELGKMKMKDFVKLTATNAELNFL